MKKLVLGSIIGLILALAMGSTALAHTHVDTPHHCQELANLNVNAHPGQLDHAVGNSPAISSGTCGG